MEFYKILLDIMDEKGLNIPETARACGLSDGTIRSMIVRQSKSVTLDVAFKLSSGLGVSLERLNGMEKVESHTNADFFDVFVRLCNERGITPAEVAQEIGVSKDMFSSWKARDDTPKGQSLHDLADYFDVGTAFLLGNTRDRQKGRDLDAHAKEILRLTRNLDEWADKTFNFHSEIRRLIGSSTPAPEKEDVFAVFDDSDRVLQELNSFIDGGYKSLSIEDQNKFRLSLDSLARRYGNVFKSLPKAGADDASSEK